VADLQRRWHEEAERNQVLPVDDTLISRLAAIIGPAWPAGDDRTYVPEGGPVCDESLPLLAFGFRITATVDAAKTSSGVLFALGDWNGGFALFAEAGRLCFAFSRAGELIEVTADRLVPPGPQTLGVGYRAGAAGVFRLFQGDTVVGERSFDGGLPLALQHGGASLRLGFDTGLPVSPRYQVPARWNGTLASVRVQTATVGSKSDPLDVVRAALHAD
jgi:arylsulfatase